MEVQKVLSNEESTPITFEFYSHGACGTDNATTSYSRHACLVHQVLIQRHALFPVAESFKETTVTMYTLLPRRTVSSYDYRGIWIRSGSRAWIRMKAAKGGTGRDQKFAGDSGQWLGRSAFKKVQRFSFSRFDYVPWFVRRHSIHPWKKRKESRAGYRLSVTILDCSRRVSVGRKGGGEESSLASWKRIFHSGDEQRNSITELSVSPAFLSNNFRLNVYHRVVCIRKIEWHELSIGINTSTVWMIFFDTPRI